jgi:hypothetical protein
MTTAHRVVPKDGYGAGDDRHNERVISVLIADDQAVVRTGFRVSLQADGDIQVVAEADTASADPDTSTGRTII